MMELDESEQSALEEFLHIFEEQHFEPNPTVLTNRIQRTPDGQIIETHSISAGLDYPSVGPEHALLREQERAFYTYATDKEALEAFQGLSQTEGIIPALESAHAVAEAIKRAQTMDRDQIIIVNLSGRGDKDLDTVIGILDSP